MREIKFRAWDGYAETMIHWDELLFPKSKHRSLINLLCSLPQDHKSSLMQFTGLRDKNGVEVYEGDLLELVGWPNQGRVVFRDGMFAVLNLSWTQDSNQWQSVSLATVASQQRSAICSVIGNVHEHPELLEAK